MILVGSTGARKRASAMGIRFPPSSRHLVAIQPTPRGRAVYHQPNPALNHDWIQYSFCRAWSRRPSRWTIRNRRQRGLERLAELGDEPGGDAFLERMGSPMSDWLIDWVFGEVHTRPGLSVRDRELLILAVLTAIGQLRPAGGRPHPRCARDRCDRHGDRGDHPADRTLLRHSPGHQRAQGAADGAGPMRAVRFVDPAGEVKIGALQGDAIREAGPAGPAGFIPTPEAWRRVAAAAGMAHQVEDVKLLHPVHPGQADRDRPQLPRPRRGVGARHPGRRRSCSRSGRRR